jgi:hypothetical protein
MDHTPNSQNVQRLAEVFAGRVVTAERTLLRAGFGDPAALNDEAYRQRLRGDHFVLPEHSLLFCALCRSADFGRYLSIADALKLARFAYVPLDAADLNFILWAPATDYCAAMLPQYVATVRENGEQFERARECFSEGGTILTGLLADQFDVLIRPRRKVSRRWHCMEAA